MAEDSKQPTQKQVFDCVKSLCISKKNREARALIVRCAGIDNDEASTVKGRMSDYIRQKTKNPIIHDMLKIEKAYFDLYHLFNEESEAEPEQSDTIAVVDELKDILPLLNSEEKAFTHYYMSYCQQFANPEDDKLRAYHLSQVIKLTKDGSNDSRLYSCALDMNSLAISSADKYNSISMAFNKTVQKPVYEKTYNKILSDIGYKYYWDLSDKMNDSELDYKNRNKAGTKAFGLIDVFEVSELKKCSYKIKLLDNLEKLQREFGDKLSANKTAIKKQSAIYKSARIRKKQTGFSCKRMEYD